MFVYSFENKVDYDILLKEPGSIIVILYGNEEYGAEVRENLNSQIQQNSKLFKNIAITKKDEIRLSNDSRILFINIASAEYRLRGMDIEKAYVYSVPKDWNMDRQIHLEQLIRSALLWKAFKGDN